MIRFALIVASTLGFVLTAALGNLMTPLLRAFRVQQEENEPPTMGGLCLMVGTLAAVGVGWTAACVAQPELLGTESLLTTRLLIALFGALCFGVVGLADDVVRLRHRSPLGLRRPVRLALEAASGTLVLALLLAGCGGSSSSSAPAASSQAASSVASPAVSEAASADCASHRGESDEVYQGDRNTAGKSRNALAEVHSENDPELGAAHRLRRLDKTGVYSGERRLSLAGEERNSSDDERENRTGNSDGGTAYDTRQWDKQEQQDNERNRAQKVDNDVQHAVNHCIFKQSALFRHGKQDSQRHSDNENVQRGNAGHREGLQGSVPQGGKLRYNVRHNAFKELTH